MKFCGLRINSPETHTSQHPQIIYQCRVGLQASASAAEHKVVNGRPIAYALVVQSHIQGAGARFHCWVNSVSSWLLCHVFGTSLKNSKIPKFNNWKENDWSSPTYKCCNITVKFINCIFYLMGAIWVYTLKMKGNKKLRELTICSWISSGHSYIHSSLPASKQGMHLLPLDDLPHLRAMSIAQILAVLGKFGVNALLLMYVSFVQKPWQH